MLTFDQVNSLFIKFVFIPLPINVRGGHFFRAESGSGREAFDVTFYSVDESSSSGAQPNNECTTVNQNGSSDSDDFFTPVKLFLERGCGCQYGKNHSSCTISFSLEELVEHRMQCIELSSAELDLVVLGALQSHMNLSSDKKRHRTS